MDFLKCSLPWVFREAPCFILVIRIILKRRLNSRSGYPDFISDPCMGYGFILSGVCQLFFLNHLPARTPNMLFNHRAKVPLRTVPGGLTVFVSEQLPGVGQVVVAP